MPTSKATLLLAFLFFSLFPHCKPQNSRPACYTPNAFRLHHVYSSRSLARGPSRPRNHSTSRSTDLGLGARRDSRPLAVRGLGKTALGVLARVDKVRVVEGQLDGTADNVVDGLHAEHERVVLVADLVPPAAEAATRPDVQVQELGQELFEHTLTLERRRRVALDELAVVRRHDLVLGLDHLRVDKALDAVLEKVLLVDRLQLRLRHLQHDGPVRALLGIAALGLAAVSVVEGRELDVSLRLVVWGVVGEDGGAVEGAVVLGEVQLEKHG